jgi:hypothetical protein
VLRGSDVMGRLVVGGDMPDIYNKLKKLKETT